MSGRETLHSSLRCYGFGERQDNCPNPPGGKWSPYFCPDCDEKRVAYISSRLDAINQRFDTHA